jgi:hypothetical protein
VKATDVIPEQKGLFCPRVYKKRPRGAGARAAYCYSRATATSRRRKKQRKVSDKMALLLRLLALSLLLAVATPIRDITDACSSQITGTAPSWLSFIFFLIVSWFSLPSAGYALCM